MADKVLDSILNMEPDIWYPEQKKLSKKWSDIYKGYFDYVMEKYGIELTFNKDYTKIKKTVWKNGKPKF